MIMNRFGIKRIFTFYIPLSLIVTFFIFPFIWIFITSIKPEAEIITRNVQYIPKTIVWDHYLALFKVLPFGLYFRNSFIVASVTSIITMIISISASYSISRFRFIGKTLVMLLFLSIHMFPEILLLIPLFVIMRAMGLLDTHLSLIIAYSTYTIPFSTWMMTGFFNSIPSELEEAAMVDGCTRIKAFIKIILPLAAPALAATLIYIFIYAWNEFVYASIFTQSTVSRTLPVGLYTLIGQHVMQWGLMSAGGIVTSIPVIIFFSFIQKQLIQGLTEGAVKG